MREFVFGTDEQYEMLERQLEDHLCHVFNNCVLPNCCSIQYGRIGFEKEQDTYALFIDRGITCSGSNVPRLFTEWLSRGTLRFLDFNDLKSFLKSLNQLY